MYTIQSVSIEVASINLKMTTAGSALVRLFKRALSFARAMALYLEGSGATAHRCAWMRAGTVT